MDLHGQNAIVAGGLFVNNGFVGDSHGSGATIIADFGSLVKGAGTFANSVITQNGGKFQAGNSPGKATFGSFIFGPGGVDNYVFAIDDAAGHGRAEPGRAWPGQRLGLGEVDRRFHLDRDAGGQADGRARTRWSTRRRSASTCPARWTTSTRRKPTPGRPSSGPALTPARPTRRC